MGCLKKVLLLFILTSGVGSWGSSAMTRLEKKASFFLMKKSLITESKLQSTSTDFIPLDGEYCPAQPPRPNSECIVFVTGNFPSTDDKLRAVRACAGNYNAVCAKYVAGNFPNFDERVAAAESCRNNIDTDCMKFVAGDFPSSDERKTAAMACRNASLDCVKYTAGNFPNFDERLSAARACGGQ